MSRSVRYSTELLLLGIGLAVAGWLARAPAQPYARASYLCAPVGFVAREARRFEAALSDHDQVIPPEHAWAPDPAAECVRIVLRLSDDAEP